MAAARTAAMSTESQHEPKPKEFFGPKSLVCLVVIVAILLGSVWLFFRFTTDEKADGRVAAEYNSLARPDGGYTVLLYTSGKYRTYANAPGFADESIGMYITNNLGYMLQTRSRHILPMRSGPRATQSFISVRTNGLEYLLPEWKHRAYERTGNTNLLRDQLKRVR